MNQYISNCCSTPMNPDYSICPSCGEHAVPIEESPEEMNKCPKCQSKNIISVEYSQDMPEHYDGISEYLCFKCKYRQGRWSGKELKEGEVEKASERFK